MKKDIILSGVGGQGILSIATVIGWAALEENLNLKQAEVQHSSADVDTSPLRRAHTQQSLKARHG